MREGLRDLYRHRELLYMIAQRDIKVRYKQSAMGFLWAVLMPILIIMSGLVVRYGYAFASHSTLQSADISSVAIKSLPWAFLVSSIRFGCASLTNNYSLVTKIYFPREIFPLAAVLSSLFDFAIASIALLLFLTILKVGVTWSLLWTPLLLVMLMMLSCGIGLLVSAASLFFRDVKFIVEVMLTFGIFFTPVFYETGMFGNKKTWLMINPASAILDGFSACIVHHRSPDLLWFAYSSAIALAFAIGGYCFFKHLEPLFAESI